MSLPKEVVIKCKGAATLPIDSIIHFQGDLKTLTEDNFKKLKNTILTEGFCSPGSVWENEGKYYAIDMHQRLFVLKSLRDDGYHVPDIPVDFVYAKNKQEAKKLILTFSSNYGKITDDGLSNFCIDAGLSVDFLETSVVLPEVSIDYFSAEEVDLPDLPDGEKTPFQQVAFMLHDSQAEIVKNALSKAQQEFSDEMDYSENENKNSNAIAFICQRFLDE